MPCQNWLGSFYINMPGFEWALTIKVGIYTGFAKRKVNIPAIPWSFLSINSATHSFEDYEQVFTPVMQDESLQAIM